MLILPVKTQYHFNIMFAIVVYYMKQTIQFNCGGRGDLFGRD